MSKELTNDQKIICSLANRKLITQVGEVAAALEDPEYAIELLNFDVPEDNEIGGDGECNHEALTIEEIQEVFDNDEDEIK